MSTVGRMLVVAAAALGALLPIAAIRAADVTAEQVLLSIKRGRQALATSQNGDGSWTGGFGDHRIGVTSLAVLALVNSGATKDDPTVKRGLQFLRGIREPEPSRTYEMSLMLSALAAVRDGQRDKARMIQIAGRLEDGQVRRGNATGMWGYGGGGALATSGDNSNTQFAVLGLRDAAEAGVPVSRETWRRAQTHWITAQAGDGGWGYGRGGSVTGSMTVAGLSSLTITTRKLRDHSDDFRNGVLNCCGDDDQSAAEKALARGYEWMGRHFAVKTNPGNPNWVLYYLYGLERAGRLGGKRFLGNHDWYREGAEFLVSVQSPVSGAWHGHDGRGGAENDPIVGTSLALLFLSKGLAPVMVNKLQYPDGNARDALWDMHHDDVRNLTDLVSGLPKWPKLVTSQTVDVEKLDPKQGVVDLLQAPVLYLTGRERPKLNNAHVELLRRYVEQGGFILAVNGGSDRCNGAAFEAGIIELVDRIFDGEAQLKDLPPEHPIYRAEYKLPDGVVLQGVDFGCRTTLVYAPEGLQLACLWNKWQRQQPPKRQQALKTQIQIATQIGVNIMAYATGREPPVKLETPGALVEKGRQDEVERGLLQVAKLRHAGGWDAAPRALSRLLTTLNATVGPTASTKQRNLTAADPNVYNYPILYMHGRNDFRLTETERERLKTYLERGGLLFADACCGAPAFDRSFRSEIEKLLGRKMKKLSDDHEIFTSAIGHDIRTVRRRSRDTGNPNRPIDNEVERTKPFLEAVEIDGRLAVVYSKYDISCALEQQASVACAGYMPEDAMRIAVNVVLYALLQDADWRRHVVD